MPISYYLRYFRAHPEKHTSLPRLLVSSKALLDCLCSLGRQFERHLTAAPPPLANLAEVEALRQQRGAPKTIRVDNGPEFISKVLDLWSHQNGVTLDFSRPGKPTDNAFIESFNGRLRAECLDVSWFRSIEDARKKIAAWRDEYNLWRPHTSLGFKAPAEFALQARVSAAAEPHAPSGFPTFART